MKNIGRFVMYQDVQSSSSVVYFEETGTLVNMIYSIIIFQFYKTLKIKV